jgi:hypothetical protein
MEHNTQDILNFQVKPTMSEKVTLKILEFTLI